MPRPALVLGLVVASSVACSRPLTIAAAPDEAKGATTAAVKPLPVGTFVFHASSTREHSCSQSFETTSDFADYELVLAAGGAANLHVRWEHETSFGPASKKFSLSSGGITRTTKGGDERFAGTAKATSDGFRLSLARTCGEGSSKDCDPKKAFVTDCRDKTIDAKQRYADVKDGGPESVKVDAWICDLRYHFPDELEKSLPGGLPLALDPGLELRFHDYGGFGAPHVAELRVGTKY